MTTTVKLVIQDVPEHIAGKPGYYLFYPNGHFWGWFKLKNKAEAEHEADRLGLMLGVVE